MTGYRLRPPFEIYNVGMDICDRGGHLCSAENPEIAKAILAALIANCPRASWCAPVVDDLISPVSSKESL
jgi:hypothetical protein